MNPILLLMTKNKFIFDILQIQLLLMSIQKIEKNYKMSH